MILSEMTTTYYHPQANNKEKFLEFLELYRSSEAHEVLNEHITSSSYDLNYDEIGEEHAYLFSEEIYRFFDGGKTESYIESALRNASFTHTEYITLESDIEFNYHWGNLTVELFGHEFKVLVCDDFYSTDSAKHRLEKLGFVHTKPSISKLAV